MVTTSTDREVQVVKDYRKLEIERRATRAAQLKMKEFADVPLRYQLLEVKPGSSLATTKVKYLLACRKHHPECGGDPEMFLRVSLAYQDVMKDYGIETINNKVVNLGNFQSCESEMRNYLEARGKITEYIPLSTLEDHINHLNDVQSRLGADLSEKLAANSDEAMWLLEDIEKVVEETGVKTVRVSLLEDGSMKVESPLSIEENSEVKPLIGEGSAPSSSKKDTNVATVLEAEVSIDDVQRLNAKNTVQEREDVAGIAARVATGVMNNTKEKYQLRLETMVAIFLMFNVGFLGIAYLDGLMRAKRQEEARPQTKEHITTNTMLPWWGNDAEYESQVKRIFLEEWRRARSSARRVQTFQEGIARETMADNDREKLDLTIFNVTAEKLKKMREHAESQIARQ